MLVDDADVAVGDQQFDRPAFVGSAGGEVVELAVVSQGDLAGLVDFVLADAEVGAVVSVEVV